MYKDVIYKQIFGCPMGSPLSPLIANMVVEEIEQIALNTYIKSPSLWVRYVDDVYAYGKNIFWKKLRSSPFMTI